MCKAYHGGLQRQRVSGSGPQTGGSFSMDADSCARVWYLVRRRHRRKISATCTTLTKRREGEDMVRRSPAVGN